MVWPDRGAPLCAVVVRKFGGRGMSGNVCVRLLAVVLVTLGLTMPAAAQITTGSVVGSVRDAQGGVIAGATIILTSESRGTKLPGITTSETGDFVFVNIPPDIYTVSVTMTGFKTLTRAAVAVSPGDRVSLTAFTIQVGGATETVTVSADTPTIQAQSGERSFTIDTASVQNLPILSRSFTALAFLAPGVTEDANNTPQRLGGGGDANIMLDGVSAMDTASNRPLLQMNVESIAEVKVLTSGYQAEYGRSSGVQVSGVTKSGTNQFHGSLYDVERNSDWDSNSRQNILQGNPKTTRKERDWGYSVGGPVGRPGGANRIFFFYSQEFSPRTRGNEIVQFRLPTALERMGDFSKTTDNNGNPFPYIRDPQLAGLCSPADQTACFRDGGVLGRIPADRLYETGVNILRRYPLPNIDGVPPQQNFNYRAARPEESIYSWQPAARVDYQPTSALRLSVKYSAWDQKSVVFSGTLPGFNDTTMQGAPVSSLALTGNYALNPTTFVEVTFGRSSNQLAGCAQAQSSTGAIFCNRNQGDQGIPVNAAASLVESGLGDLPLLFPDATLLNPAYYAVKALDQVRPPYWDGSQIAKVPNFAWGGRVANPPPNTGFPAWLSANTTKELSASLTRVYGRHTVKAGYYHTHSYKAEQTGGGNNSFGNISFQHDPVDTNIFDTGFGFANAAIGTFSSYSQAQRYAETSAVYQNIEMFIQDNWKTSSRLTLDYGVRFVFQRPQVDQLGQASNFLPQEWSLAHAPTLYMPGCSNGIYPCSSGSLQQFRRAMNPLTREFVGTSANLGLLNTTLVPGTGDPLNGLFLPGQNGVPDATYFVPTVVTAPRFGMAYDLTGQQSMVLRGGIGMFYDRPSSTTFSGGVQNPPTAGTVQQNYAQLQSLRQGGLITQGAPSLNAFQYEGEVPTSVQFNGGLQMALPWSSSIDVSYAGQHSYNFYNQVNINSIDLGAKFLPSNQDLTQSPSATPGATSLLDAQLRPMRGYGSINMQLNRGWRTYHSIQLNLQRRFTRGLALSFADTISLSDRQQTSARLQHDALGNWSYRADQKRADELLGNNNPSRHLMNATFVWDLPDLNFESLTMRAIGYAINDWQLSGVWRGETGRPYSVDFAYQNGASGANLTGSPNFGARIVIIGDPGKGCSSDPYRQFNYLAFAGPQVGSDGLESGSNYLKDCFRSTFDLSIQRNIRLGGGRNVQLRADVYNAPNSAIITNRRNVITFQNTSDFTVVNAPFEADGKPIPARVLPNNNNAGPGVATGFQTPRTVQVQMRFQF
jgi:hypothetical protein